jgi:hypothetical protein
MNLDALRHSAFVLAWAALMLATLVSFGFGDGLGTARVAGTAVIIVAFVKVNLVGNYFMELRGAPLPLRLVFATWTVIVGTTLTVIFLVD